MFTANLTLKEFLEKMLLRNLMLFRKEIHENYKPLKKITESLKPYDQPYHTLLFAV